MPENSKISTVLVVGATGSLGMEICQQLVNAGRKVKGFVRSSSDPAKVKALKQLGAEIVEGDLKYPESINKAIDGVVSVISTASSTLSRQAGDSIESVDNIGQLNLVQAANDAGVNQFIYISFYPMALHFPLQTAKRNVEKKLLESKMNYTILQPSFFMEIWLSPAVGFDFPHSKVIIYGEGKNKLNLISLKDVAAIAAASLDKEAARKSIFQLGGPEAVSPLEVVKIFEEYTGNKFSIEHVPIPALQAQKTASTDSLSESFAALMLAYAEGDNIDMKEARKVFPFRQTSVADYVHLVPLGQAI